MSGAYHAVVGGNHHLATAFEHGTSHIIYIGTCHLA